MVTPPAPVTPPADTPVVPDETGTTAPLVTGGTETPVTSPADKPTGKPVDNTTPPTTDKSKPDNGKGPAEHQLYFYHPDHLGSTGYVTDAKGAESSNTQRTPYGFTGKELDKETGLHYFGARYYDARTSVWASVDPILGSYLGGKAGMGGVFNSFNLGLYSYSHLNPVKFVDPDGNQATETKDRLELTGKYKGVEVTGALDTQTVNMAPNYFQKEVHKLQENMNTIERKLSRNITNQFNDAKKLNQLTTKKEKTKWDEIRINWLKFRREKLPQEHNQLKSEYSMEASNLVPYAEATGLNMGTPNDMVQGLNNRLNQHIKNERERTGFPKLTVKGTLKESQ